MDDQDASAPVPVIEIPLDKIDLTDPRQVAAAEVFELHEAENDRRVMAWLIAAAVVLSFALVIIVVKL